MQAMAIENFSTGFIHSSKFWAENVMKSLDRTHFFEVLREFGGERLLDQGLNQMTIGPAPQSLVAW